MKLLLRIAYDGKRYCGYQKQENGLSIQEALTTAISTTLGFPCRITGCSRTDAGVHALGFCATVEPVSTIEPASIIEPASKKDRVVSGKAELVSPEHAEASVVQSGSDKENADAVTQRSWLTIPPAKFHRAAKRYLPADIAITGACIVPDEFHPRYSVEGKTYIYRMSDRPWHDPFCCDRVWETYVPFTDAQCRHMHEVGQVLVGRHDFGAFMASGSKIVDPTRTITALSVERTADGYIQLRVSADGFLYNMVRIITGTLWEFGKTMRPRGDMVTILESRDRTLAGKTAPACGLYLASVLYPAEYGIRWLCE